MPALLSPLFCSPQDVYDMAGIDAAQLRLDDTNQASGQTVQTGAAAAIGATALTIAALQYPLLAGTVLVFQNAGMEVPVEVTLSATAATAAVALAVQAIDTAIPSGAQATDNGVNVWLAKNLVKACNYATAQVMRYCRPRYQVADLATSFSVNNWATVIAVRWLAKRRYLAAPQGAEEDYKEAVEEMKKVQTGAMQIENIATRTSAWPFITNLTLSDVNTYRKVRVETVISESTPAQYNQAVDWGSVMGAVEW